MATVKPSTTIFLDSSALIPLLESTHVHHQRLVQYLKSQNASRTTYIDAVVLSEYLVGADAKANRDEIVKELTRQFNVVSFDSVSAKVCSELFRVLDAKGQVPKAKSKRQIAKADLMIFSSAIVSRAAVIISGDGDFSAYHAQLPDSICGYKIPALQKISELPEVVLQADLTGWTGKPKDE